MLQLCKAAAVISRSSNIFMNFKDVSWSSTTNSLFLEQQPPAGQGVLHNVQYTANLAVCRTSGRKSHWRAYEAAGLGGGT
jgi:hypothetical protein